MQLISKKLLNFWYLPKRDMHLSNVIIAVFIAWLLSLQNVNTSTITTSTSTTTTSTSTTATSTSSTAASTSTTKTSTSFASTKSLPSFKSTTGLRIYHTSDTLQTPKASSSDGTNVIAVAVAVPIAVIAVAIVALLAYILIYKKRKLCFKDRHDSSEKHETNSDSPPQIPEIIASKTTSSVPP